MNPKEYYELFIDHSDNKKHKGLKTSTLGMGFDSYFNRLSDLTEYSNDFLDNLNKVEQIKQKRFEVKNESMQMKSASKVQFGQLNDKWFYFSNGIISLPSGHPYLEELRKEKHKYQDIHRFFKKGK